MERLKMDRVVGRQRDRETTVIRESKRVKGNGRLEGRA